MSTNDRRTLRVRPPAARAQTEEGGPAQRHIPVRSKVARPHPDPSARPTETEPVAPTDALTGHRRAPAGRAAGRSAQARPEARDVPVRVRSARPDPDASSPAADAQMSSDLVRVSKRMSELGLASRREADEWIERGWVRVDGEVAILGQRVTSQQEITIDRRAHAEQARRVTVLLHKPVGYVSGQAEDGYQPAVVLVIPEAQWQPGQGTAPARVDRRDLLGLAPAGRLDIDSTGLLVLTQDGRIAKQLIGENSAIEKEYLVRVRYTGPGRLPHEDLQRLNYGLELDGKALRPAKVSWSNEDQLRFVLREGKKRQIRRMCELVGLEVLGLKRIRIGRVPLGDLPVGKWRFLGPFESFD